jgi:hypothetical protein
MTKTGNTKSELSRCTCGCGQPANRQYLPGHDAKHVAELVRKVKSGELGRREAAKMLPSAALKNRLRQRLSRLNQLTSA